MLWKIHTYYFYAEQDKSSALLVSRLSLSVHSMLIVDVFHVHFQSQCFRTPTNQRLDFLTIKIHCLSICYIIILIIVYASSLTLSVYPRPTPVFSIWLASM